MSDQSDPPTTFREQVEALLAVRQPIVRENLTPEESDDLLFIHDVLNEFLPSSFEHFEREFLRKYSDRVIETFKVVAVLYHLVMEECAAADPKKRSDAFHCIVAFVMGLSKPRSASDELWKNVQEVFQRRLRKPNT